MASTTSEDDIFDITTRMAQFDLPLQSDELNGTNPYEAGIPPRINCNVPLEVKIVAGRGRSVSATEGAKVGEVIFNIPEPLVYVPDFEDGMRICDSCFAYEEHGGVMSVPNKGMKFVACGSCKTVLYCNNDCQKTAWKHHHRYECTFRTLFAKQLSLRARTAGLTQRLASMYAHNQVSNAEWVEIRTMFQGYLTQDAGEQAGKIEEAMNRHAKLFWQAFNVTGLREVSETEVRQMGIAVANYAWTAHVPMFGIDGGVTLDCQLPAQIALGWLFDPFPALVNHSCKPNAFYYCNGREMVARALRDIKPGEEVTYNYNAEPVQDYADRRALLKEGFDFDCTCVLCEKGDIGPKGELRESLQMLLGEDASTREGIEIEFIEKLIKDMKKAGWYHESGHMYQLLKCAAETYISNRTFDKFIKTYLTLFTIASNIAPSTPPQHFFGTRWALAIMNPFLQATNPALRAKYWIAARLTSNDNQNLTTMLDKIWLPVLENYVADLERFYGEAAPVVKVAKDNLEAKQEARVMRDKLDADDEGDIVGYAPMSGDEKLKDAFVMNVNELLKWAGLLERTREEVVGK